MRPANWWTVEAQTGWRRPGLEYLCREPEVLALVRFHTYDPHASGFDAFCCRRLGFGSVAGVKTLAVRAALQDAWDLFTPFRDCIELWTPSWPQVRRYAHGIKADPLTFIDASGQRLSYGAGVKLGPAVRADDPRLAKYPTINC